MSTALPLAQEYNYEMGRLLYDRTDYSKAFERFERACTLFLQHKQFDRYVECLNYLLRILVEREDFTRISEIKDKLTSLSVKDGAALGARTHYILGLCSYYRDGHEQAAMDLFQKALKLALEKDNKLDMCYAIYGIANSYYSTGRLEDALKELYNLEVFFQSLNVPDLQISSLLLSGLIHRNRGAYDKALEFFWQAYEMLKANNNLLLYLNALYGLGSTYQRMGDLGLARVYLQLAVRASNEKELPRMTRLLRGALAEVGTGLENGEYDLVFDPETKSVVEKSLGRVDFKNQFILIDLLHLFLRNPGKVFSKEVLVRKVWNQDYNPAVHDNKIYVTIKRLRQLIEPDFNKPKYVFRGKNGYFLNKTAKVLVGNERPQ